MIQREELFSKLFKVSQTSSNQWRANCPACGDNKQHLYISFAPDGKILLDCKKGCTFSEVAAALDIPQKELCGESPQRIPWKLLREHIYTDINGGILAKKQIYRKPDESKTAVWYRLEGGRYIKGLNGLKLPPYHLHLFTQTTGAFYIVEGEKDTETMERLGFSATTSPNGAGAKWRKTYNNYFIGRDVIIIADNDEAGDKYGKETAERISAAAASVKLIRSADIYPDVPEKGDISDIAEIIGDTEAKRLLTEAEQRTEKFTPEKRSAPEIPTIPDNGIQSLTASDVSNQFKSDYVLNSKRKFKGCDYNYCKFFIDTGLSEKYYLNTFSDMLTICEGDTERPATDDDLRDIRNFMLEAAFKECNISLESIYNDIRSICPRRNPVQDYFNSLHWDGTPRAERLLIDLLGAPDDVYVREATKVFLLGIISRVFNPGTKFDYMIVLQGKQGLGKTAFFKAMAIRPEWYAEISGAHMQDRKLLGEDSAGKIIVEYGELDGIRKTTAEKLKATITRTDDNFRAAYGRLSQSHPRKFVIGGTTNSSTYLSDPTGNRRFLPIPITKQGFLTPDEVNQVWAEAYTIYLTGNFKLYLSSDIEEIAESYRSNVTQLASDDFIEDIQAYVDKLSTPSGILKPGITPTEIYKGLYEPEDNKFHNMSRPEAIRIIQQALERLGWVYKNKRVDGSTFPIKAYWRP